MADEKRKQCYNSKWSKIPVLIEEALDDVIVVCLKYGTKEFRGILLDTTKRNVPHGICFASKPPNNDKSGENDVNSTPVQENVTGHQEISVSTTSQRFTYNHNPSEYSEKPVLIGHRSNFRTFGKKSVRDIRLRPRQTLCSNCKKTIHDHNKFSEGKSNSNALSSTKAGKASSVSSTRSPSRYLAPPKHAKPGSSRSPSHYVSNRNVTACKWSLRNRSSAKEVLLRLPESSKKKSTSHPSTLSDSKVIEEEPVKAKYSKVEKPASPKATPFIKISYGDGAVLNIPPRLPGVDNGIPESGSEDPSESPQKDLVQNYVSHKKLKKAMKKAKERERHRSGDQMIKSTGPEMDEKCIKISSHHKKHKRKHRHRHGNQYHITEVKDNRDCTSAVSELAPTFENGQNGKEENVDISKETTASCQEKTKYISDNNFSKLETNCSDSNYMYVEYDEHPLVIDEGANSMDEVKDDTKDNNSSVRNDYSDWVHQMETSHDEDHENSRPLGEGNTAERPRLVYMWKQNQGLARVEPRTGSSNSGDNRGSMSSDDLDQDTQSRYSDISESYGGSESDACDNYPGSPHSEVTKSPVDTLRPLMMKIQSQSVSKCVIGDDRTIHVEDIVWGKIQGFPWWPGRVMSIMVTQKDNGIIIAQTAHVAWFGSSTMSHMQCSELYPFLEDFKLRYNKKKRGPYRSAIKQATLAAQAAFSSAETNIDIDMDEFEL